MDRKTFIRTSAGMLMAIPALSVLGCSSSDDGGTDPDPSPNPPNGPISADCLENGTNTSISANHGHSLTVSRDDVDAGVEKTYTLSEANTDMHVHQVTLSQENFNALKNNNQISVNSSNQAGHNHSVSVSCA